MAETQSKSSAPQKGVVPQEWPTQATSMLVDTIATVRDKTTRPARIAARGAVFGLLAAIVGVVALVLLLVLLVRLYVNYVPGPVWPLYAGLFVVFTVAGVYCILQAMKGPSSP